MMTRAPPAPPPPLAFTAHRHTLQTSGALPGVTAVACIDTARPGAGTQTASQGLTQARSQRLEPKPGFILARGMVVGMVVASALKRS